MIGLDPDRDKSEIERLGLEPISPAFIDDMLTHRYAAAGFETIERGILPASEWREFKTSWAKRLQRNETRAVTYLIARAV